MTQWIVAADAMRFGERAATAGIVTLQGMVTIFVVLALLWGVVEIMHRVIHKGDKKAAAEPAAQPLSVAEAEEAVVAEEEDDGAIVAASTAAVTAFRAEEGSTTGFRVVSFRRAEPAMRKKRF